jgi:glycine dehydrogenase
MAPESKLIIILNLFAKAFEGVLTTATIQEATMIQAALQRTSAYLTHPVFNSHHSENGQ